MNQTLSIQKHLKTLAITTMSLSFALLSACSDDAEPTQPPTEAETTAETTYTADVKSILNGSCAFSGCHTTGAGIGGLATYNDAKTYTESGKVVGAIKHESGFSAMPKNGSKLSDEKIATIEKWITDGYKE
jgi:mono/diheme cytochrome c family protein